MGTRGLPVTRSERSLPFLPTIYGFSTKNYGSMSVPNHPLPFASKEILPNSSAICQTCPRPPEAVPVTEGGGKRMLSARLHYLLC